MIPPAWVRKGRDKFQIAIIGSLEQTDQRKETVDILFHDRYSFVLASVTMIDLPVNFELGDIIDRGLNPQHQTKLIIHLDGNRTHMVTDSGSLDTGIKVVADFALVTGMQFSSQKSGDILGFNRVNGTANKRFIEQLKIGLFFKDNIGGIFDLSDRPMVGQSIVFDYRTIPLSENIQRPDASLPPEFYRRVPGR